MTKDEALKLALEALEVANSCADGYYIPKGKTHLPEIELAITAIKEALAQPEQEPMTKAGELSAMKTELWKQPEQPKVRTGNCLRVGVCASEGHKIAPQRTWVGLTDEDKSEICDMTERDERDSVMRLVEAKLKARNI
jgi:hypothetical protein